MSIFDGVMGSVMDLGSALAKNLENSGAIKGGGGTYNSATSANADYKALMLENRLSRNMNQQPYGPSSFRAGQTNPAPQVNSDIVNQQWLQRLNRYSSIPQVEGARAKGA